MAFRLRFIAAAAIAATAVFPWQTCAQQTSPRGVQLTVYNQNFGLVKDHRTVALKQGMNTVTIDDVAALIQPETVHFSSLTAPGAVQILEQNYQYDLLDPQSVINKSVGKRVVIRDPEKGTTISGTLLNPVSWEMAGSWQQQGGDRNARGVSPVSLVIKTDQGVVLNATGQIELMELPEGLVSKPRLVWQLDCAKAAAHDAEISYLTQGLNWSADYVAVAGANDDSLDLQGWVTLTNSSGASFRNATLQLVAGDVRRVQTTEMARGGVALYAAAKDMSEQFREEKFFDYHLYTLQRPTDVLDRETKQVSLLGAEGVKAERKYYYDGLRNAWWWRSSGWRPGEQYDTSDYKKVNVTIEFKNSKESGLGMPLPKGTVRVYKKDNAGKLQFVGEDAIDHTPVDEKLKLYVGDAFDVVGEHKRTQFTRVSDQVTEEAFEITLRNHKDSAVRVTVVEHVTGDWQVLEQSHKWEKVDASTLNFPMDVPAKGETVVKYKIRTRF